VRTKSENAYELVPLETDVARIRRLSELLRATYGQDSRFTEKYVHWQYVENPEGRAVGFDAFAGDELAAHYVALPLSAELFGYSAKGLLSLNTATSPAHQGKGLFTRVATAVYERASSLGYDFVIGVANANSTGGFVKKLGFQLVCPLDVRIGIGRPRNETSDALHFRRIWSDKSLRWRLNNPAAKYALRAGALWADPHIPGVNMYLGKAPMHLEYHGEGPSRRLLTGWIGIMPAMQWHGVALPIPQLLRPSPLNLIFRDLTGARRTLNSSQVVFQALDFDAY